MSHNIFYIGCHIFLPKRSRAFGTATPKNWNNPNIDYGCLLAVVGEDNRAMMVSLSLWMKSSIFMYLSMFDSHTSADVLYTVQVFINV